MKKKLSLFLIVVATLLCALIAACGRGAVTSDDDVADEDKLIIRVSQDAGEQTLKDYMDVLQANGEFTYSISNGMVTEINGKANTTNSYWMLYTSDSENSNNQWGTFEYGGEVYGSAMFGATELMIKGGCLYIWAYQTF